MKFGKPHQTSKAVSMEIESTFESFTIYSISIKSDDTHTNISNSNSINVSYGHFYVLNIHS